MMSDLGCLESTLGYRFHDQALLVTALTHPSYVAEQRQPVPDNQRLEFLGDAVLQLLISDTLFHRHPAFCEGRLTKARSALANEAMFAHFARRLQLGLLLRVGKGEATNGGRERQSNLADAFEAVIGAVYLDGGLEAARHCLTTMLETLSAADTEALMATENPKGALQELTQERFQTTPTYELLNVLGPDHSPQFEVRVSVAGQVVGSARAGNRKNAEKQAAQQALSMLSEQR